MAKRAIEVNTTVDMSALDEGLASGTRAMIRAAAQSVADAWPSLSEATRTELAVIFGGVAPGDADSRTSDASWDDGYPEARAAG